MYTIFRVECKKALSSRKNRFVLILYAALLLVFALTNHAAFSDAREREIQQLTMLPVRINDAARSRWTVTIYNPNWMNLIRSQGELQYLTTQVATNSYHTLRRMEVYARQMVAALRANDRAAEVFYLNELFRAHIEQYAYGYYIHGNPRPHESFAGYSDRLGRRSLIPVDFHARIAFYQANQEFTQHFVDNDILFLYENEMRGINFVYQVLRQLLPLTMLFIVILAVSDVFTSDNQWGSYKFMLTNPISRNRVFFAKILAASTVAFVMVFAPILILGLAIGIANGFGPHNYPILTQMGAYATFAPLQNNLAFDREVGNFLWRLMELAHMGVEFTNTGLAYVPEFPVLGLTPITSSHGQFGNYLFTPNPALQITPMLSVIFMTLPIYMLLILVAVAVSALLSVVFQRNIPVLITGTLLSLGVVLFPAPESNMSVLARLNPYLYTNPINILNGLGSTTALTGVVVLAGWSAVFITAGLLLFKKRDIRC